jgi:hypothetical protein
MFALYRMQGHAAVIQSSEFDRSEAEPVCHLA